MNREQMNIVVTGHVDHGKSTVIGRLMADTNSLPEGKLEQVKAMCLKTSRPFEYAFLLDALMDEQAQGITIDSARCFFGTAKREYIIIDAPGHIEFLKNMVSGAARAEAALLVIDALEGVQENSRRHGYLLSMLGINQVSILINKMDLVDYEQQTYEDLVVSYGNFLKKLGVTPECFIPISAREGDNIASRSTMMPWYTGPTVIEQIDSFNKSLENENKPFRFPVQDVYKFTEAGDDRRIFAGTVETGSVAVGDTIEFYPSGKKSKITSIEAFNQNAPNTVSASQIAGFTFKDELYIKPGEIMVKSGQEPPLIASRFRVNIFWMSKAPMIMNHKYKIKIATARAIVRLVEINSVIDASDLTTNSFKNQIDRHDVADCILESTKPLAFDIINSITGTGRFVIVDNYEIAGGGIILEKILNEPQLVKEHIKLRERVWERGLVSSLDRLLRYRHRSKFILVSGEKCVSFSKSLEKSLFQNGFFAYYFNSDNLSYGLDTDLEDSFVIKEESVRRLGELARIITDSGQIFVASIKDPEEYDMSVLKTLTAPYELLHVKIGGALRSAMHEQELFFDESCGDIAAIDVVMKKLRSDEIIPEYSI